MQRREFCKIGSALGLSTVFPQLMLAQERLKTIVLVELKGGNDGLNTLIPVSDPLYEALRPTLAIKCSSVLDIGSGKGMHPSLSSLMPYWQDNSLAWVMGVGYPMPNRSHFRSIEIWESASNSDEYREQGWLSEYLENSHEGLDGIVIGKGEAGPLFGGSPHVMFMNKADTFKNYIPKKVAQSSASNPALMHLLNVKEEISASTQLFRSKMSDALHVKVSFPKDAFGQSLQEAARVLVSGIHVPVIKVSLGSFDTHSNQLGKHSKLLGSLGEGLAAFAKSMKHHGLWDEVVVMSYSEFGRRVKENGSKGTDHGTAAPHFLLGGKVKGGLYGTYPSLEDLDNGDLKYSVDYRRLYQELLTNWWGTQLPRFKAYAPLGILS